MKRTLRVLAIIAIAPFVLLFLATFSPLIVLYLFVELFVRTFNFAFEGKWEGI